MEERKREERRDSNNWMFRSGVNVGGKEEVGGEEEVGVVE